MQNSVIASMAKYKCSDCEIAFPYLQQLYRHKTVCKQQSKSSMCSRCGRALGKHHYTCKECNRCFAHLGFFESHQLRHKKDARKRSRTTFKCDYCGKVSASQNGMQNHIKIHMHEKPFKCDICDRYFAYKGSVEAHRLSHRKVKKEKQFKCNVCNQKLSSQAKVEEHIRVHNNVNRFECDVCLKLFSNLHNMKQHKRNFHPEGTPESSIASKISVDASTSADDARKRSVDTDLSNNNVKSDSIGDSELSSGDKLFCCQKCQLKFSDLSSFLKHRRMHTGVKPYTCSFCNTGFCNASSLKQHVTSLHAGEEEESQKIPKSPSPKVDASEASTDDNNSDTGYKCVECDKVFFQFGVYNRHKIMHKRAEQYQAQKSIMTNVKKEHEVTNTTEITNVPPECGTPEQVDFSHDLPSVSPVKFSCLKCGIDFNSKISLRGHLRKHARSKTFTCSCGKNFSYKSSMMKHKDQHCAMKTKGKKAHENQHRAMKRKDRKHKDQHGAMKRKGKKKSMSPKGAQEVGRAAAASKSSFSKSTKKAYATRRKSYT